MLSGETMRTLLSVCLLFFCIQPTANAAIFVSEFEGVADAGNPFVSIVSGPSAPYTDPNGFVFQGTGSGAIFDSTAALAFNGNTSDFVGFGDNSSVIITHTGGQFDLISLVAGPSSDAGTSPVLFQISSTLFGGGAGPGANFSLTVATPLSPNFTGLGSVTITAADDSAFDTVTFNTVPEPSTISFVCLGCLAILRRRSRS